MKQAFLSSSYRSGCDRVVPRHIGQGTVGRRGAHLRQAVVRSDESSLRYRRNRGDGGARPGRGHGGEHRLPLQPHAAHDAVKDVFPQAIVMMHLASPQHSSVAGFFKAYRSHGGKWDMNGFSSDGSASAAGLVNDLKSGLQRLRQAIHAGAVWWSGQRSVGHRDSELEVAQPCRMLVVPG